MVLSPISALFVDTLATFLNQFGLIQMKVAHQEAEKTGKNPYCTCRWIGFGLCLVSIANTVHVFMLPFGDMSLFTTTCAAAILFSGYLSIKLLNEKFVCKYDVTATVLIVVGCVLTIAQMNTSTDVVYTRTTIFNMLISWKSGCLMLGTIALFVSSVVSYKKLVANIIRFQSDMEIWQEKEAEDNFPPSPIEGQDAQADLRKAAKNSLIELILQSIANSPEAQAEISAN